MRWYWILIGFTLFALTAASPKALLAVQHLMPTTGSAAMPIILLSLAVLSAFAALVLSSRNFGLLALAFGLGITWMQQGYLHSLTRLADAAPHADLQLSLTLSNVLHGAGNTMQNEGPWLLPLTLCALLMAGVLMLGPKVE
jgi:hypothetical protein